jgi:hypothetical protein
MCLEWLATHGADCVEGCYRGHGSVVSIP